MQFNTGKTDEVSFSCKRNKSIRSSLNLEEEVIASKVEHKHLGVFLDSMLNVKRHIERLY